MKNNPFLEELTKELLKETSYSPNARNILPFWDQLNELQIEDFIVYNYLNYPDTYLENLLLALFPLWKNLTRHDWETIFEQLKGDNLAEYYMKIASDKILGIDPGFESTKNLTITAVTFPDNQKHNASSFMPEAEGQLKDRYEKILRDNFGLSFNDLIEVNNKLIGSGGSPDPALILTN